jgi:formylglycine-generating enzyme required for sulfatase activity
MTQDLRSKWLIAIMVLALPAAAAQAATIQTVPVGNLGNTPDTRYETPGYGAVSYSYNIGKYEVTAGQYTEFLNAVAATDTHGLYNSNMWSDAYGCKIEQSGSSGSYIYSVAGDWADRPVNFVSLWDAARFANWLHNGQGSGDTESGAYINIGDQTTFARQPGALFFIPTEDEWYKAAYHKNDGDTGNYFGFPTRTNTVPSNDLVEPTDPGNNATFLYQGDTIGSPYYRTEVGAHENSDSPYGTFDQGGNVWERTETAIGSARVHRGGAFNYVVTGLRASSRWSTDPSSEGYMLGFRVASSAAVPEPGSVAMLAGLAVMGLLYWRRVALACRQCLARVLQRTTMFGIEHNKTTRPPEPVGSTTLREAGA